MTRTHDISAQVLVVVMAVSGMVLASVEPGAPTRRSDGVDLTGPARGDGAGDLGQADRTSRTGAAAGLGAAGPAEAVHPGEVITTTPATAVPTGVPTTAPPAVPTSVPIAVPTAVPPAAPAPVRTVPELPACSYDDVPTRFAELSDWSITLLDTALVLSPAYRPDDLVPLHTAGVEGWGEIRALAVDDLRAMDEAARAAGAGFAVQSAFRDHATQHEIFQAWVATIGEAGALAESARPGHSEHQLGTALDLRSAGSPTAAWEYPDWGQTPAGTWLRENSWQYGFVLSYPEGQRAVTCYDYESWHFRYIGRERAQQIRTSGLTPREHLWRTSEGLP